MEVKCHRCDYEWVTRSAYSHVTCPRCKSKTSRVKKLLKKEDANS